MTPVATARARRGAARLRWPRRAPQWRCRTIPRRWPAFVAQIRAVRHGGAARGADGAEVVAGNALTLALPVAHKHLADKAYADKLKAALEQATGRKLLLAFEVGAPADSSLAAQEKRERAEARAQGEAAFRDEPFVRDLISKFDGQVKPDTVAPIARDGAVK